jgi:hypothetical protein
VSSLNIFEQKDFTGGLNLRSDQFQLADNESPKMLNVEIDPRGGVFSRGGMKRINSTAVAGVWAPDKLVAFPGSNGGTPHVMLSNNDRVFKSSGGDFSILQWNNLGTPTDVVSASGHGACMAVWGDTLYVATGASATAGGYSWRASDPYATKINRSSYTPQAWQTVADPSQVKMPQCEHLTVHASRMWAAWTSEEVSGVTTAFPNRVRYSITGTATNWAENGYFDLLGGGNGITGMAVANGSLIVFKPSAVYIIYGNDPTNFGVIQLSDKLGCSTHHAMTAADNGVYFYSLGRGLYFTDGNSIIDVFQNIRPLVDLGYTPTSSSEGVSVSWVGGRVWLSLPYSTTGTFPAVATANFVFDPTLAAYMMFQTADNYGVIGGCEFLNSDNNRVRLMIHPTQPYVLSVDNYAEETDTITASNQGFASYYRTKWFDAGSYSQKKMFRRPDIVLKEADSAQTINVRVYHDFNEGDNNWKREFNIVQSSPASSLWGSALWGSAVWSSGIVSSTVKTGKNLGLARTVQLQFNGPVGQAWGINSIGYKFNSRRVAG